VSVITYLTDEIEDQAYFKIHKELAKVPKVVTREDSQIEYSV
jgi:hypothetical protein